MGYGLENFEAIQASNYVRNYARGNSSSSSGREYRVTDELRVYALFQGGLVEYYIAGVTKGNDPLFSLENNHLVDNKST